MTDAWLEKSRSEVSLGLRLSFWHRHKLMYQNEYCSALMPILSFTKIHISGYSRDDHRATNKSMHYL